MVKGAWKAYQGLLYCWQATVRAAEYQQYTHPMPRCRLDNGRQGDHPPTTQSGELKAGIDRKIAGDWTETVAAVHAGEARHRCRQNEPSGSLGKGARSVERARICEGEGKPERWGRGEVIRKQRARQAPHAMPKRYPPNRNWTALNPESKMAALSPSPPLYFRIKHLSSSIHDGCRDPRVLESGLPVSSIQIQRFQSSSSNVSILSTYED